MTPDSESNRSVNAGALEIILPVAFVDDYAPYLRGKSTSVHAALIMREPHGSPNVRNDLAFAHSNHEDLAGFARRWLNRKE